VAEKDHQVEEEEVANSFEKTNCQERMLLLKWMIYSKKSEILLAYTVSVDLKLVVLRRFREYILTL